MQRFCARRLVSAALACVLALGLSPRAEAYTSADWKLMTAGNDAAEAGDLEKALEYWIPVIPSLKAGGDLVNCGNYARKAARALDQLGRYDEAVAYYDEFIACWRAAGFTDKDMLWEMRRAEQLRPRLEVFVSRPTFGLETANLALHEPAFGALFGGTTALDPALSDDLGAAAETYGKPYGMVMLYASVGEPVRWAYREAKEAGAVLHLAWQPTGGLQTVTEPAVRALAKELADYELPVFLRFGNEMNGAWVAWHDDPELYKQKFRLVARIMREETPNVAMVFAPGYVGDKDYKLYYPGDEWVDWVGISAYHDAYFLGNMNRKQIDEDIFYQGKRSNPLDKFREIYETYSDRKPIMIAETGYNWTIQEAARGRVPYYDESQWAADTARYVYAYLPMVYPRIKAVGHFNNKATGETQQYLMSANPTLLKAVREAIADDWYLSGLDQVPESYWLPIEQATLHGQTRIASYVWLGDRGLGRVEYRLDGRLVASRNQVPYTADIDLSGLTGEHVLTVQAYDRSGRLVTQKEYRFDASGVTVRLDGRVLDFARQPVNESGRILVPFRAIAEALGADVQWNAQTRTAIARKGGTELRLTIDDPVPVLNGRRLEPLSVPARIVDGHTMVPARVFAEAFGMKVDWDGQTRTVLIDSIAPDQPAAGDDTE